MKLRGSLLALALVAAAMAGCVGTQDAGEGAMPDRASEDRMADRSLAQAPALFVGEWWNVTVTNELDDGAVYEERLVVAGEQNGSYVIGTPGGIAHELLVLHLPGVGLVDTSTFGFEAHDALFEPVQFPLEPGQTWETDWYTGPLDAEVVEANATHARVEMIGDNTLINVTYEAGLGLPARIEIAGYGSYEVTGHGVGFEGDVEAPIGRDLAILNGRVGPALDPSLQPAPPVETVTVEEGYDQMTVALVLGNLVVDQPTSGAYRASATAPDGTTYEATFTATPDDQVQISPHGHPAPGGDWQLEYEAAGPGVAVVEAVAYDVYEASLGSGSAG